MFTLYSEKPLTDPDLGVLDGLVHSAAVGPGGELIVARKGIVTCYDVDEDLVPKSRWIVDFTALDQEMPPK